MVNSKFSSENSKWEAIYDDALVKFDDMRGNNNLVYDRSNSNNHVETEFGAYFGLFNHALSCLPSLVSCGSIARPKKALPGLFSESSWPCLL